MQRGPGAPTCSAIPLSLAWGQTVPSYHGVPRGGAARVLARRSVKPSRRDLWCFHTRATFVLSLSCSGAKTQLLPFLSRSRARWWLQLEARKTSRLHYGLQARYHTTPQIWIIPNKRLPFFIDNIHLNILFYLSFHVQIYRRINCFAAEVIAIKLTCHKIKSRSQLLSIFINEMSYKI